MYITRKLVESLGKRSPVIRAALVQAGDKVRIRAMKKALLGIGVCELTQMDVRENDFDVGEKKFSFCAEPLSYVLLDDQTFRRFPRISSALKLEASHMRNGVIGIRRKAPIHA